MLIETGLLIALVVVALAIVGLVLIQQGKGADMGASFGSGASQTLFGSQGSGNFLTRSTWVLAFIFFGLCLGLAVIAKQKAVSAGKVDFEAPAQVEESVVAPKTETDIPSVGPTNSEGSDIPQVNDQAPKVKAEKVPAAETNDIPSVPAN